MTATSVMPGMARIALALFSDTTVPLMVGGRTTMVGSAPGTCRSMANCFCPVTMSSASMRFCGVPRIRNVEGDLSSGRATRCVRVLAASAASSP